MPNLAPKSTIARSCADFIKSGLRLVGSLRSGQNLTNSELTDCQQVLNDMLDAWSAERTMIITVNPTTVDQNGVALSLVANKQSYTLGNVLGTEDFLLARPARLERASVLYSASQQTPLEKPLEMYDDVQWQGIANKTTKSLLPEGCFDDQGFPDRVLFFWPIPTQANPVTLYIWALLTQFADLNAKFSFPPAYAEAIRYNLAMRLAAEFPCDLQKLSLVAKFASESKRRIESFNAPVKEATCDEALLQYGGMGNIYTGTSSRSSRY